MLKICSCNQTKHNKQLCFCRSINVEHLVTHRHFLKHCILFQIKLEKKHYSVVIHFLCRLWQYKFYPSANCCISYLNDCHQRSFHFISNDLVWVITVGSPFILLTYSQWRLQRRQQQYKENPYRMYLLVFAPTYEYIDSPTDVIIKKK